MSALYFERPTNADDRRSQSRVVRVQRRDTWLERYPELLDILRARWT